MTFTSHSIALTLPAVHCLIGSCLFCSFLILKVFTSSSEEAVFDSTSNQGKRPGTPQIKDGEYWASKSKEFASGQASKF